MNKAEIPKEQKNKQYHFKSLAIGADWFEKPGKPIHQEEQHEKFINSILNSIFDIVESEDLIAAIKKRQIPCKGHRLYCKKCDGTGFVPPKESHILLFKLWFKEILSIFINRSPFFKNKNNQIYEKIEKIEKLANIQQKAQMENIEKYEKKEKIEEKYNEEKIEIRNEIKRIKWTIKEKSMKLLSNEKKEMEITLENLYDLPFPNSTCLEYPFDNFVEIGSFMPKTTKTIKVMINPQKKVGNLQTSIKLFWIDEKKQKNYFGEEFKLNIEISGNNENLPDEIIGLLPVLQEICDWNRNELINFLLEGETYKKGIEIIADRLANEAGIRKKL